MGVLWNALDANDYLARMELGRRGEWLSHLLYTSEDHSGLLTYWYYLLLGKVAGLLNVSSVLMFHAARVGAGALMLAACWRWVCRYFPQKAHRRVAYLLIIFGSGLGWLVVGFGLRQSTDFWVAESQALFSIVAHPHYALSAALLLFGLLWMQDGWEASTRSVRLRAYTKAGTAVFVVGWIHPFMVLSLGAAAGLFVLCRTARARLHNTPIADIGGLVAVGVMALPGPLYTLIATSNDPIYRQWMAANQTLSPAPIFYVTGYGLLLAFALVGAWQVWRHSAGFSPQVRERWQFVMLWLVSVAVLLYLPTSFQRRMVLGAFVPLDLLATLGIFALLHRLKPRTQARRATQMVILTSLSTLLMLGIVTANAYGRSDGDPYHPLYWATDEVAALDWLHAHTAWTDTVVAGAVTGNFIPANTGTRVFCCHDLETIDRDAKLALLERFYRFEMSPDDARAFVARYGIRYVWWGTDEARLLAQADGRPTLQQAAAHGWALVYSNAKVQIYRTDSPL